MPKRKPKSAPFVACTLKELPKAERIAAAMLAIDLNPMNRPGGDPAPDFIGVYATKFWGPAGADGLGVAFLDNPPADLRTRLLAHANAWGENARVRFVEVALGNADIRIARTPGQGHFSYLGTDCRRIPRGQPTMNLDSFTMQTRDSEFFRVVRHEFGHALGAPHEHMRRDQVARVDPQKAYAYFLRTQGWDAETVRQQVLTPIEDGALLRPTPSDETSIMCYQLPGSITKDGRPIVGGSNINPRDAAYMGDIHPKATAPPPPTGERARVTIEYDEATNKFSIVS
jgi:hypothetical protein